MQRFVWPLLLLSAGGCQLIAGLENANTSGDSSGGGGSASTSAPSTSTASSGGHGGGTGGADAGPSCAPKDCTNDSADNCGGVATCDGACDWSDAFAPPSGMVAAATQVVADGLDDIYAAGTTDGSIRFQSTLDPKGSIWVSHLATKGGAVPAGKAFTAGTGMNAVNSIGAIPGRGFAIAGSFTDSLALGKTPLKSKSTSNVGLYVAAFDSFLALDWRIDLSATKDGAAVHLATDSSGNIYLAGILEGSIDLPSDAVSGSGSIKLTAGAPQLFLAKYSAAGKRQWAFAYEGLGDVAAFGSSPDGHLAVAGTFSAMATIFGQTLEDPSANPAVYLLYLDGSSESGPSYKWSTVLTSDTSVQANAIAVGVNKVALAGSFAGNVASDGGDICDTNAPSSGYVVQLGLDGMFDVGLAVCLADPGPGATVPHSVAIDGAGALIVIGETSDIDFGGPIKPFVSDGKNLFVAKYLQRSTARVWSFVTGATTAEVAQAGNGVATDPAANVLVAGQFNDAIGLGCPQSAPAGETEAVILKLKP